MGEKVGENDFRSIDAAFTDFVLLQNSIAIFFRYKGPLDVLEGGKSYLIMVEFAFPSFLACLPSPLSPLMLPLHASCTGEKRESRGKRPQKKGG